MECRLHVGGVERRRLNEAEVVLFCEALALVCGYCPQMPQVRLVPDQHDHDVRVGVITELAKPTLNVLVRQVLGNVVHQERAHGTPVVTVGKRRID